MVTWGNVTTLGSSTPATPVPGVTPTTGSAGFPSTPVTPSAGFPSTPVTPSATASTPLFGAKPSSAGSTPVPTGGFGFGTPAGTTPNPVGGINTPASTGGMFGAPPSTSTPGFGGFGGTTAATPAFGSRPAPTPTPAFGVSTTPSRPTPGFPAQQPLTSANQEIAQIESSLLTLRSAYDPVASALHHTPSRFQYIFYDPSPSPNTLPPRPPHIDVTTWSQAMAQNPDPNLYTPVSVVGADALVLRITHQQQKANQMKECIGKLRDTVRSLEKNVAFFQKDMEYRRREQELLSRKFLGTMRKVEILRCMNLPLQGGERDAKARLENIHTLQTQLQTSVQEVERSSKLYCRKLRGATAPDVPKDVSVELTSEDRVKLHNLLDDQRKGLESLIKIVQKDVRNLNIARDVVKEKRRKVALPPSSVRGAW